MFNNILEDLSIFLIGFVFWIHWSRNDTNLTSRTAKDSQGPVLGNIGEVFPALGNPVAILASTAVRMEKKLLKKIDRIA